MKRITYALTMAIMVLTACTGGSTSNDKIASSTDSTTPSPTKPTAEEPWVAVDSATEMKAWMDYATPGDAHKMLAKSDGNWTAQTTMWMKAGASPTTSTGAMSNKMIMGGRYQASSFSGNMMGMPFEGMGTTGYDNFKKKYISTWIDNMGTGIMKMEGTWDNASKTISFTGKCINPANGRECDMREVYTYVDDNNEMMEMYGPDSQTGKEYKTMEIKLTRKK